jgi:error-prone DNA polymerase
MPETPNFKLREPLPPPTEVARSSYAYAELEVSTNFSFLRGASHPDELVYQAATLGYRAAGVTDRHTLAGMVRAHAAAKGCGLKLLVGTRLVFEDAPELLVWAPDRKAYGRMCRLLTIGKRRAEKGECKLFLQDFVEHQEGLLAACVLSPSPCAQGEEWGEGSSHVAWPSRPGAGRYSGECMGGTPVPRQMRIHPLPEYKERELGELRDILGDRLSLVVSRVYGPDDDSHVARLAELSRSFDIPLLATNGVHYHDPNRRALQDVLTCIRHGCTIHDAGYKLFPNAERYLKSPEQMHRLFAEFPQALHRGVELAERCDFNMGELKYEYPDELVPEGQRPIEYLSRLTWSGARERYPTGIPDKVRRQIEHELHLIEQLHFEAYFLTVHDVVRFARSRDILCQGRGSAANSSVCYCLGVTSVDPARIDLLFERFVSAARGEPPDIDIDFEHERREEVIQYLYNKYDRDRCGMSAEVITYRGRSAIRDVGKAMGLSLDMVDSMAKRLDWWHRGQLTTEMLKEAGLDPNDRNVRLIVALAGELLGFPRHLGQHVGGMVMTRGPLCELVPIENAAMEERTVIEWDKDDIEELGILKVDVLGLGMLTCIAKGLKIVNSCLATEGTEDTEKERDTGCLLLDTRENASSSNQYQVSSNNSSSVPSVPSVAKPLQLHTVPAEDPAVYDMICDADTVGVFQIESRAQMSMLPRLRPRNFYDIVIEVAIVRPGPIQGNMVHPYLRRRNGEESVTYPSEALRDVLQKTLGVPLFQEQAMRVAMVGAGFTADEADKLRRAMAAWRKSSALEGFHVKIVQGMLANGYTREFAEQCFMQIRGFGEYGFPESHSASFALLVYVSAWIKRHHPAAFCAALLNSQPMGFYAPAQIVRDAKEHGVEVRSVDVNHSEWDCTLEPSSLPPSPGTPREGRGEGSVETTSYAQTQKNPHPNPLPEYRERGQEGKHTWGIDGPAVRLGFRQIKRFAVAHGQRIVEVRKRVGRFNSINHFHRATNLPRHAMVRLAEADAFTSLGLTRRQSLWEVMALSDDPGPLFDSVEPEAVEVKLPTMPVPQEVMTDYSTTSLSLKRHPLALVRDTLKEQRLITAAELQNTPHGRWVKVAGLVLIRQRPGTASGIVFVTLEDETGVANLIVRPDVFDRFHVAARHAALLQCDGYVERQGQVVHVMAKRLFDRSHLIRGFELSSRDFH